MEELTPFARLTWPTRTERLLIRPLTEDDVPALFAIRRQTEVARWMTASPDDYAEFARAFSEPARTDCMLVMLRDDVLIGDLYLAVSDAWAQKEVAERAKRTQAEIGWCVDPAYAGQGYASEGAAELLRLCFDGLKLRRVTAGACAAAAPRAPSAGGSRPGCLPQTGASTPPRAGSGSGPAPRGRRVSPGGG